MRKCSAWELWRVQNQVADVLVIVNLKPMEGLPVFGRQVNSRISVYFQEEDLKEYRGRFERIYRSSKRSANGTDYKRIYTHPKLEHGRYRRPSL